MKQVDEKWIKLSTKQLAWYIIDINAKYPRMDFTWTIIFSLLTRIPPRASRSSPERTSCVCLDCMPTTSPMVPSTSKTTNISWLLTSSLVAPGAQEEFRLKVPALLHIVTNLEYSVYTAWLLSTWHENVHFKKCQIACFWELCYVKTLPLYSQKTIYTGDSLCAISRHWAWGRLPRWRGCLLCWSASEGCHLSGTTQTSPPRFWCLHRRLHPLGQMSVTERMIWYCRTEKNRTDES